MNEIKIVQLIICTFLIKVECEIKERINNKKLRVQVEEIGNQILDQKIENDDDDEFKDNFVSMMVNNAKEIFKSEFETAESTEIDEIHNIQPQIKNEMIGLSITSHSPVRVLKQSIEDINTKDSINADFTVLPTNVTYGNFISSATLENAKYMLPELYSTIAAINKDTESSKVKDKILKKMPSTHVPKQRPDVDMEPSKMITRSCIMCNNLASEDCNEPLNKLVNSIQCDRDDDMCYSMHTPFGIIDRGCFNPNYNLTTYVCSCNICNYLSISEMPYMFRNKKQWIDNVIDISRTRRFRKSVFKNMSCLKCEVNTTLEDNVIDSANCLEGNIGKIPVETCDENEVCAIKALRAQGYIWRGCIKAPLYNYWWTLCNADLCNGDKITSLYDYV